MPRAKTVKKVKLVGPKKAKRASQYRFLRDNARSMPSPDEIANMPEEMRVWQASKLTTRLVNGVTRVYGVSHTQLKRQIGEWATICSQLNDEHPDPGIDSQWDKMCQLRHRLDKRSISETDLHHVMLAVGMVGMTSCQKKLRHALDAVIKSNIRMTVDDYSTHCNVKDVMPLMLLYHGKATGEYDVDFSGDGREIASTTTTMMALRVVTTWSPLERCHPSVAYMHSVWKRGIRIPRQGHGNHAHRPRAYPARWYLRPVPRLCTHGRWRWKSSRTC